MPLGSTNSIAPLTVAEAVSSFGRFTHPWPRSCLVTFVAAGKNPHACAAACTELPPVSIALIAMRPELRWKCQLASQDSGGGDSVFGYTTNPPLPSAPKFARQVHEAGASNWIVPRASV